METILIKLVLIFIMICIVTTIPFIVLILWHDHKKRQEIIRRLKARGAKHIRL